MFSPQTIKQSSPYGVTRNRQQQAQQQQAQQQQAQPTCQPRSYIAFHYRDTQHRRRVHEFRILWDTTNHRAIYAEQNHSYPIQLPFTATLRDILARLQLHETIVEVRWVDTQTPFPGSIFDSPVAIVPVSELMLYEPGYHETHWMEA